MSVLHCFRTSSVNDIVQPSCADCAGKKLLTHSPTIGQWLFPMGHFC